MRKAGEGRKRESTWRNINEGKQSKKNISKGKKANKSTWRKTNERSLEIISTKYLYFRTQRKSLNKEK